jgi:hypothetical protein
MVDQLASMVWLEQDAVGPTVGVVGGRAVVGGDVVVGAVVGDVGIVVVGVDVGGADTGAGPWQATNSIMVAADVTKAAPRPILTATHPFPQESVVADDRLH